MVYQRNLQMLELIGGLEQSINYMVDINNWVGGLVTCLEHEFYDFPYIGNNNPNWSSYFSEG